MSFECLCSGRASPLKEGLLAVISAIAGRGFEVVLRTFEHFSLPDSSVARIGCDKVDGSRLCGQAIATLFP